MTVNDGRTDAVFTSTWAAVEAVVEGRLVDGLLLPQRLGPAQSAGFHLGSEEGGMRSEFRLDALLL